MEKKLEKYRKYIFAGIIIIALGIILSTTMAETMGSAGIVLIAIGGLFFIIGMSMRRKIDEGKNQ
jgi:drug/metabolite transporter superfamily protein YnfA